MLSIPEAAALANVPERTMRDRLKRLDGKLRADGRARILERAGKVWMVRLEALRAELRTVELADQLDGRMESLESTVDELGLRQVALRDTLHAEMHAEMRRQEKRWEAQAKVNAGLRQALAGMTELAKC
jgi:ABC-type phosphate transport system auxiliary subunit